MELEQVVDTPEDLLDIVDTATNETIDEIIEDELEIKEVSEKLEGAKNIYDIVKDSNGISQTNGKLIKTVLEYYDIPMTSIAIEGLSGLQNKVVAKEGILDSLKNGLIKLYKFIIELFKKLGAKVSNLTKQIFSQDAQMERTNNEIIKMADAYTPPIIQGLTAQMAEVLSEDFEKTGIPEKIYNQYFIKDNIKPRDMVEVLNDINAIMHYVAPLNEKYLITFVKNHARSIEMSEEKMFEELKIASSSLKGIENKYYKKVILNNAMLPKKDVDNVISGTITLNKALICLTKKNITISGKTDSIIGLDIINRVDEIGNNRGPSYYKTIGTIIKTICEIFATKSNISNELIKKYKESVTWGNGLSEAYNMLSNEIEKDLKKLIDNKDTTEEDIKKSKRYGDYIKGINELCTTQTLKLLAVISTNMYAFIQFNFGFLKFINSQKKIFAEKINGKSEEKTEPSESETNPT